MNYDNWLVHMEHEYRGWNKKPYTCLECDKEIEEEGHCSLDCFNSSML